MGVIYKLKEDLITFIINQKKEKPYLSCRNLVGIIHQNFQIEVSKSSINTVLKGAHLSSPVGRRPLVAEEGFTLSKMKKFQIPAEKKTWLLNAKQEQRLKPTESQIPVQLSASLSGLTEAKARQNFQNLLEDKKLGESRLCKAMGYIFLKAAEWELSDAPILGKVLKNYFDQDFSSIPINQIAETLLFMNVFDIKNLNEIPRHQDLGPWVLSDFNRQFNPSEFNKIIEGISDLKKFYLSFSIELSQILKEAFFVKLFLEDGSEVGLDPQMTSIWPTQISRPIPAAFSSPICKATSFIIKQIVNNFEPAILSGLQNEAKEEWRSFLLAFENTPGKIIQKIVIYDNQQKELTCFPWIPKKRRQFILGIWPRHQDFSIWEKRLLLEEAGKRDSLFIPPLQKQIHYYEKILSFNDSKDPFIPSNLKVRVLGLMQPDNSSPYLIILTNACEKEYSAKDLICSYVLRWPNLEKGNNIPLLSNPILFSSQKSMESDCVEKDLFKEANALSLVGKKGPNDFITYLVSLLNKFFVIKYFPQNHKDIDTANIKSIIYELSGACWKQGNHLIIKLNLPKDFNYKGEVEFAISSLNERSIRNFQGEQVYIIN